MEYCTDSGGSQNTESYPTSSIGLRSYNATVRWCDLRNGQGDGIRISSNGRRFLQELEEPSIPPENIGKGYAIYGNRIKGFENVDLMFKTGHPDPNQRQFELVTPDEQDIICGNDLDDVYTERIDYTAMEQLEFDSPRACPGDIPEGDGIGHTGGDSPWG